MARGRNKQDRNWNSVGHRNITLTYHAFHRRRIEKDQTGLGGGQRSRPETEAGGGQEAADSKACVVGRTDGVGSEREEQEEAP